MTRDQVNTYNRIAGMAPWSVEEWDANPEGCLRRTRQGVRKAAQREWGRGNDDITRTSKRHIPSVGKDGRTSKTFE